ncbi:MAG: hypothetical protein ACI4BC_10835 [Muribaculaceae bacterium]
MPNSNSPLEKPDSSKTPTITTTPWKRNNAPVRQWNALHVQCSVTVCDPGCNSGFGYGKSVSRTDLVPGQNLLDLLGDKFRSLLGDRVPALVFLGFDSESIFLRYDNREITVPTDKTHNFEKVPLDYAYAELSISTEYSFTDYIPVEYDLCTSQQWDELNRACATGDSEALTAAGYIRWYGCPRIGVEKDWREANRLWKLAAGNGNLRATTCLAVSYLYGEGIEHDIHKGAAMLLKAVDAGDVKAKRFYAIHLLGAPIEGDFNTVLALDMLYDAYLNGDIKALEYLGFAAFEYGDDRWKEKSFELLQIGATQYKSDIHAYYLWRCYVEGIGVEPDQQLADSWLKTAADRRFPTAQYYWGLKLFEDYDDVEKALRYLTDAADNGDTESMFLTACILGSREENERATRYLSLYAESAPRADAFFAREMLRRNHIPNLCDIYPVEIDNDDFPTLYCRIETSTDDPLLTGPSGLGRFVTPEGAVFIGDFHLSPALAYCADGCYFDPNRNITIDRCHINRNMRLSGVFCEKSPNKTVYRQYDDGKIVGIEVIQTADGNYTAYYDGKPLPLGIESVDYTGESPTSLAVVFSDGTAYSTTGCCHRGEPVSTDYFTTIVAYPDGSDFESVNSLHGLTPHGIGKMRYPDGSMLYDIWDNGTPANPGNAIPMGTKIEVSMPSPFGETFAEKSVLSLLRITYPDGSIYSGYRLNHMPHGEGRYTTKKDGFTTHYIGNFENGLLDGIARVEKYAPGCYTPTVEYWYFNYGKQMERSYNLDCDYSEIDDYEPEQPEIEED